MTPNGCRNDDGIGTLWLGCKQWDFLYKSIILSVVKTVLFDCKVLENGCKYGNVRAEGQRSAFRSRVNHT